MGCVIVFVYETQIYTDDRYQFIAQYLYLLCNKLVLKICANNTAARKVHIIKNKNMFTQKFRKFSDTKHTKTGVRVNVEESYYIWGDKNLSARSNEE